MTENMEWYLWNKHEMGPTDIVTVSSGCHLSVKLEIKNGKWCRKRSITKNTILQEIEIHQCTWEKEVYWDRKGWASQYSSRIRNFFLVCLPSLSRSSFKKIWKLCLHLSLILSFPWSWVSFPCSVYHLDLLFGKNEQLTTVWNPLFS